MGLYMRIVRQDGGIREATLFGIVALLFALIKGKDVAAGEWGAILYSESLAVNLCNGTLRIFRKCPSGLVFTLPERLSFQFYEAWDYWRTHTCGFVCES